MFLEKVNWIYDPICKCYSCEVGDRKFKIKNYYKYGYGMTNELSVFNGNNAFSSYAIDFVSLETAKNYVDNFL